MTDTEATRGRRFITLSIDGDTLCLKTNAEHVSQECDVIVHICTYIGIGVYRTLKFVDNEELEELHQALTHSSHMTFDGTKPSSSLI